MENKHFHTFAGLSSILSAILYILSIIGLQAYIAGNLSIPSEFIQNMNESHGLMLLYGWPGLLATLLILPIVYLLYRANVKSLLVSKMLLFVTFLGLIFIQIAYLFHLALSYFHAPMYDRITESGKEGFGVLIQSTVGLQDMFWLAGDLFAFLGIAGLLILVSREKIFPNWILIIGILSGILAAVGSLSFIPAFKATPGLSFLFIGGFSVFTIWELLTGIFLFRSTKFSMAPNLDMR